MGGTLSKEKGKGDKGSDFMGEGLGGGGIYWDVYFLKRYAFTLLHDYRKIQNTFHKYSHPSFF